MTQFRTLADFKRDCSQADHSTLILPEKVEQNDLVVDVQCKGACR